MTLLQSHDQARLRERLAARLQRPVHLLLFTARHDCDYCGVVQDLLSEVAELHEQITLAVFDLDKHADRAAALGIDKAPGFAVLGGIERTNYGIRFYGMPSGYEFAAFLEALEMVGSDTVNLQPATKELLADLRTPLHVQVFVTPTCPYCPKAVALAHRLAYASPLVTADMVEVGEFPELQDQYQVFSVPRTVISDVVSFDGVHGEAPLREQLVAAVKALA